MIDVSMMTMNWASAMTARVRADRRSRLPSGSIRQAAIVTASHGAPASTYATGTVGDGVRVRTLEVSQLNDFTPDEGDANAMYRLGQVYDEGLAEVNPDLKAAVQWYEKAAAAGDKDAQFAMGCIHSAPRTKWTSDQKAAQMFEKAAEQGHEESRQFELHGAWHLPPHRRSSQSPRQSVSGWTGSPASSVRALPSKRVKTVKVIAYAPMTSMV